MRPGRSFVPGARIRYHHQNGVILACYPDRLCHIKLDSSEELMVHEDSLTLVESPSKVSKF
jgi:hypothetical protein